VNVSFMFRVCVVGVSGTKTVSREWKWSTDILLINVIMGQRLGNTSFLNPAFP
jgi:hypothetical protein